MKSKKFLMAMLGIVLALGFVLVGCSTSPAPSAPSSKATEVVALPEKSAFYGAWELQTDAHLFVFYFMDDSFALYTDGERELDGIYSFDRSELSLQCLNGTEIGILDFAYRISSDELVLSKSDANISGTYKKSSFTETGDGNNLIGVWKTDEEENTTAIIRFFPDMRGRIYNYTTSPVNLDIVWGFTYKLDAGTFRAMTPTGQNTFRQVDFTFAVNGDTLLLNGKAEYKKK